MLVFHRAFCTAALLPGSEHEDAGGGSSTSGLSKWLWVLRENPISSSSSSPSPLFPLCVGTAVN